MMQVMEPGGHPPGSGGWARPCDACRSTACSVYCRFEALYLCGGCDRQAHAAELLVSSSSRHERVWVCEACGRAPATVTCKADAAALCTACDADVHDANPLTRRHQRLPIVPIEGIGGGEGGAAGACWRSGGLFGDEEEDGYRSGGGEGGNNNGYNGLFGGEVDEYLDLAGFNSCADEQNNLEQHHQQQHQQPHHEQMQQQQHREYEAPEFSSVTSLNHSVSVSSMDASVVPDGSSGGQPDTYTSRGTPLDLFVYPHQAAQVLPQYMAAAATTTLQSQFNHPVMDREARVMRYREKRKNRKFEKTIRYASRKAYAETRPRIKGRFAKRTTDVEVEVDQLFSQGVMAGGDHNGGYGVVPTY